MSDGVKCCPHCGADIVPVGKEALCWLCRTPLPRELLPPPGPRPWAGPLLSTRTGGLSADELEQRARLERESATTRVALGVGLGSGTLGVLSLLFENASMSYAFVVFGLTGAVIMLFGFAALHAAS